MPRKLQRSLQDYLSKIKTTTTPHVQLPSKKWILSGCKHPKTLSFAIDKDHQGRRQEDGKVKDNGDDAAAAATLSDIDKFLLENFKSLYVDDQDDHAPGEQEEEDEDEEDDDDDVGGGCVLESPRFVFDPPRRNLRGSTRFFVGSGTSSSLIEEARLSLTTSATTTTTSDDVVAGSSSSVSSPFSASSSTAKYCTARRRSDNGSTSNHNDRHNSDVTLPDDCIPVVTYSPSPYDDFRLSMQEMVEARVRKDGKVDWEFMEELLLCYLDVNDKKSHKFVLSAFVDLAVALRRNPSQVRVPAKSQRTYSPRSAREKGRLRRREGI